MKQKELLPLLAAIPLGCIPNAASAQKGVHQNDQKPNVVVIYADDLGYGDVSCNGSKTISTPNIDRVAGQGVRFTNMHSTAAQSTPSRYSLLTGEYAWRLKGTGVAPGDAAAIIKPDRFTLPGMFKNAGYRTAAIGKWHLGLGEKGTLSWNQQITPGPNEIGFTYSFIMPATGDRVPCVYVENGHVVNLDPNDPISVSYRQNFEGEPTGKDNPELLKMHPSPGQGHNNSIVNGISRIGYMKGGKSARWVDEDMADVLTGKAISFIKDSKDSPFFLYFATHDIHVPRVPNQRFVGKSGMGPRGDAILQLDWCVGQIAQTLKELGLDKNTILIISSDNGPVVDDGYRDQAVELLGNHKPAGHLRGGKYSSFEGGTRVLGIVRWTGHVKPAVSENLTCQIDMLGSFASMLHQPIPQGAAPDSENQLSTWLNKKGKGRQYLVLQNVFNVLSIENGRWKYISPSAGAAYSKLTDTEYGNKNEDQLFDLATDPGEKVNKASENPKMLTLLKAELGRIQGLNSAR